VKRKASGRFGSNRSNTIRQPGPWNRKAAPRGGFSSKTGGLYGRAGARVQARISAEAAILVTAAVDRG
jgi:hypothetical protein